MTGGGSSKHFFTPFYFIYSLNERSLDTRYPRHLLSTFRNMCSFSETQVGMLHIKAGLPLLVELLPVLLLDHWLQRHALNANTNIFPTFLAPPKNHPNVSSSSSALLPPPAENKTPFFLSFLVWAPK